MSKEMTLDKGWEDACLAFHRAAGIDLKSQQAPTADIIRAQYEDKKSQSQEDHRKSERVKEAFNRTLTCIDRIGGVAAQDASMVFGSPASIAGSALSFFIAAGVAYRQIFGDIEDLLGQIVVVFERFQVYRDDQGKLPPQITRVANKLLVTLVEICGLCYQTLKKNRLKTFLNITLFGDDSGVRAQLARLQAIQAEEGQMRGTLTLVATEKTRRSVETGFAQTNTQLETLSKSMQTMQTRVDNREELKYLSHALEIRQKDPSADEHRRCLAELSSESCGWIHDDPTYQSWSDRQGRLVLVILTGEEGVGKTCAFTALLELLQARYPAIQKSTHHVMVASVYVTQTDKQDNLLSVSDIIRSLAWQVAQDDLAYRSRLVNACKRYSGQSESAVDILQRTIIGCMDGDSTLFLAIDGIQNLSINSQTQLKDVIRALIPVSKSSGVKMLLGARTKFAQELAFTIPTVVMLDLAERNNEDMRHHITTRLDQMRIFQKRNSRADNLKQFVSDGLSQGVQGSFLYVDVLLGEIENAYNSQDVEAIVERAKNGGLLSDSIKVAIAKYNQTLSVKEIEDLNTILLWTLFGAETLTVEILEAILCLKNGELPLKPIYDQITEQFFELFATDLDNTDDRPEKALVSLKSDTIKDYFMNMDSETSPSSSGAATIREVRMLRNIVEKFCDEDLYRELDLAAFFEQKMSNKVTSIIVDPQNANAIITAQCLRALLDEREELFPLRFYASRYLIVHLQKLATEGGHARTEADVGPLMIKYLTDTSCIARTNVSPWNRCLSFADDVVDQMVRLLRSPTVVKNVMATQDDDRRWVLSIQTSPRPEIDILMPTAKFMAKALSTVEFGTHRTNSDMPDYKIAFQWIFGLFNKRQHTENPLQCARIEGLHEENELADRSWQSMYEISIDTIHDIFDLVYGLLDEERLPFESLFRLAQVYGICGHKSAAISKLQECLSMQPNNIDVMAELALTHAPRFQPGKCEDYEAALHYVTSIMKEEKSRGIADKPDSFSETFESDLIKWHLELQHYDEVEKLYAKNLDEDSKDAYLTRQRMLLAHRRGRYHEVVELLQAYSSQNSAAEVSEFFLRLAYGCDFEYAGDSFEAVAHSFKQQNKLASLQETCTTVLDSTIRATDEWKWAFFLSYDLLKFYLAQTYYENPVVPEDEDRAVQLWEEIVTQNRSSEFQDNPACRSLKHLAQVYAYRAIKAGRDTLISKEMLTKIEALGAAASEIDNGQVPSKAFYRTILCRYYLAVGDLEAAKAAIRPDVDAGIKLLLDSDLENDWKGYEKLGHAFMSFDDDDNAMAAWRMIGPTTGLNSYRKKTMTTSDSKNDTHESSLPMEKAGISSSTNGDIERQLGASCLTERVKGPVEDLGCDGECGRQWTFADDIWICRDCISTHLDSKCYEMFQTGSFKPLGCNFQHKYAHIPSWDALSSERVEAKMVLVGENTISLAQWLAEISRAWNIED